MNFKESEEQLFFKTYKRLPLEIDHGEGCFLYTKEGKKYLDMFSGLAVNALGYAHPAVVQAITDQAKKYTHLSNFFIQEPQLDLAARLLKLSGFQKIFFTNSGTEAVEGSIKLIRKWGKPKNKKMIYGMTNGFSGRSMGALSLMDKEKYRDGYEPFLPNFGSIEFNDVDDLTKKIDNDTAAIFLEFIQGEGGIVGVTEEFVNALDSLREKFGFLIVADEIQSGLGRTGKLFAYEHFKIVPDIITAAKPIGGGLPLGAILGNAKVSDVWTYGVHGTTFGGNPVACAAGVVTVDLIMNKAFLEKIRVNSVYFSEKMEQLQKKYTFITQIRSFGYMIGIELSVDSTPLVEEILARGVLVNSTANTVIRILPPLIAGKNEFDILLNVMEDLFQKI